jgi:hypothetical protein
MEWSRSVCRNREMGPGGLCLQARARLDCELRLPSCKIEAAFETLRMAGMRRLPLL